MAGFTLIDVENGMFDLSLHTILTPPCFTFFWGIIQTCNRFKPRFKNPFTLTIAQAQAAGGGVSRQAIWDKQQRLNKVKIDGRSLIHITAGSRKDNKAAKYQINYNLIVGESVANREFTEQPSNIIDEQRTNHGRTTDDPLTILRSEEKRKDKEEAPKTLSPKKGIPGDTNIKLALKNKWGIYQISDVDVNKLLTALWSFRGMPDARPPVPPEYAPIEFWFAVINRMNGAPQNGINSVIEYGRTMWNDWAKENKISLF